MELVIRVNVVPPDIQKRSDQHFVLKVFLSYKLTCPILGPLVPLFWISSDVSSGFQSQSGFCLIHNAVANLMYIL